MPVSAQSVDATDKLIFLPLTHVDTYFLNLTKRVSEKMSDNVLDTDTFLPLLEDNSHLLHEYLEIYNNQNYYDPVSVLNKADKRVENYFLVIPSPNLKSISYYGHLMNIQQRASYSMQ